mmetsp:Transcript_4019/g.10273  ORF Transcript_4019/g.10273 Transcript_4019/m.10273 type:complete len:423 (+) Transcript_4019:973-2241(+)
MHIRIRRRRRYGRAFLHLLFPDHHHHHRHLRLHRFRLHRRRVGHGGVPSGLVVRAGVPGGSLAAAESGGVDKDLRRKVEAAIAGLAFRVTAGDVAARAGVSLADAEAALRALAADSMATLNVSSDGEVLYVFRENFRALVRSKSLVIKLEPIADGAKMAAAYLARVSFGTALIVSIVVVFAALVVLSSSAGDRDSRGRGRSSSAFMYSRMPMRFSIFDYYVSFWDPFYYRRVQERARNNQPLNMLEGICSFVFGDGDPNFDRDDRKWILIARAIRSHKGVVAAEQLRPFLDVASNSDASDASGLVDESYMIPVLQKFSGEAKVDGDGNIVYVFPDIMTTTNTATDTAGKCTCTSPPPPSTSAATSAATSPSPSPSPSLHATPASPTFSRASPFVLCSFRPVCPCVPQSARHPRHIFRSGGGR